MPMFIRRTEGRTTSEHALPLESLPVELYFKVVFDNPKEAAQWCHDAATSLSRVTVDPSTSALQRVVIWGPPTPEEGWVSGGFGTVFVSELALRLIRALGGLQVPGAEPVSLSQLEYSLTRYMGTEADERAYRAVRGE